MTLSATCEICDSPEECLSGMAPCSLADSFIGGPYDGMSAYYRIAHCSVCHSFEAQACGKKDCPGLFELQILPTIVELVRR